ncbi:MAG: hypothetical protein LBG19_09435 [Prevotellaceae bacterium]|jgi:hypothetical protein|nr:hypothetical protein [Prevotellaceae bacterium]
MKTFFPLSIFVALLLSACGGTSSDQSSVKTSNIEKEMVQQTLDSLKSRYPGIDINRATRGVEQVALLWQSTDGSEQEFMRLCTNNYVNDKQEREELFNTLSNAFESLFGSFNKVGVDLKLPMHLADVNMLEVDQILGGYDVSAHFTDDMYANKVAFITMLNFPAYNLKEKTDMASSWSRLDWAYARMGDMFTSRVPAELQQKASEATTIADVYISEYNIMMGRLLNNEGKKPFPENMKLISHWNLRDELKSNYADKELGLEKQQMIYEVMKRIVTQEIPEVVINNPEVDWNPMTNKVYEQGKEISVVPEPNVRYQHLLNNFIAQKAQDPYNNQYPTFIQRAFDKSMEFSKEDVERIFVEFISSPQVKDVAALIEKNLGRKLQPFDIWYDGFKPRSNISEEELNVKTRKLYPNKEALQAGLPVILRKLGFSSAEADRICSKIQVDASRGAGHAWGAAMKGEKARLRSRIAVDGLDYKGYNIAVHEFGHNVEQTISLYDVDCYMLNGVPNTAFTEALAFVFQKRDLDLLGMSNADPMRDYLQTLDNFWGCYEIMGVSLVDMKVWEWMYANPNATKEQLKENVIRIAQDVWNIYYAPILGEENSPILGIYSHMIDSPLYLANYPMGHLIEFQLENHLKGKSFADEISRIYRLGTLIPQEWMRQAVGNDLSSKPMLEAAAEAIKHF